jgi:hypothetical protein
MKFYMGIQDKILQAIMETQSDVQELKSRIGHIEEVNIKTYEQARWLFDTH